MKRITRKQVLNTLLFVLVVGAYIFISWARNALPANDIALQALISDDLVEVTDESGLITFEPLDIQYDTGFIFYPGGRVDYRAYAPTLRQIAARGYFVALVPVPLNLAYLNTNAANQVIELYPDIQHWAIGGHSLGGVAASTFISGNPNDVDGLVLWASYPADDSLVNSEVRIVSIYGTLDGLSTGGEVEKSKALLPPRTLYVPIEGGNHAQFGSYGSQPGDNPATISAEDQWTQITEATVMFLESLKK
ncbi:MAG TPA: alpha/beta hydrolase [Anaerolineales bacterium]